MTRCKGFTLTELLITIAIIAILAAIALPQYLQGEAARAQEAVSQLAAIKMGEQSYKIDNGEYYAVPTGCTTGTPPCWEVIGVDHPEASTQRFFDYQVVNVIPGPPQFCAVATRRNANPAGNPNAGQTVCMDQSGQYFGTHPNGPNPTSPAAGACSTGAAGIVC